MKTIRQMLSRTAETEALADLQGVPRTPSRAVRAHPLALPRQATRRRARRVAWRGIQVILEGTHARQGLCEVRGLQARPALQG